MNRLRYWKEEPMLDDLQSMTMQDLESELDDFLNVAGVEIPEKLPFHERTRGIHLRRLLSLVTDVLLTLRYEPIVIAQERADRTGRIARIQENLKATETNWRDRVHIRNMTERTAHGSRAWAWSKLPPRSYPCAMESCAIENSWPADHLYWHSGYELGELAGQEGPWVSAVNHAQHWQNPTLSTLPPGWYCETCLTANTLYSPWEITAFARLDKVLTLRVA